MKKLSFMAMSFFITASVFANEVKYKCKEHGASNLILAILNINAENGNFNGLYLQRDKAYIPGNGGKKYYRYLGENFDLLIPSLMVKNKINQGNIVLYFANEKLRLSCYK